MTTRLGLYMVFVDMQDISGLLSFSGKCRALIFSSLYLRDHVTGVFSNQISRVLFNQSHTFFELFLCLFFFLFTLNVSSSE